MMICPSCEARNSGSSAYCLRCGASLEAATQESDPGGSTDALTPVVEDTPALLVSEAAAQLAEGQSEQAIENCRRAIALNPGLAEAHAVLGMAYEREGNLEAALEAYEAVVGLDPQRLAEQQKASLLRLRLDGRPAPPPCAPPLWQVVWQRLQANLPLTVAVSTGVLVFLIGSIILITSARAGARRQVQEQYRQAMYLGDQAMADQNYAQAVRHYQQAWELRAGDNLVRSRWDQAYRLSTAPQTPERLAAQMPKYIPSSGPNPFNPVTIGGRGNTGTAVPPEQAGLSTISPQTATVGPPTALDTFRAQSPRPLPPATTGDSGRRKLPEGPAHPPVKNPLTPAPAKTPGTNTKAAGSTPATDTAAKPGKGEITIWVSDAPKPSTPDRSAGPDPDSVRSRADALAAEGRRAEAISEYARARGLYEDRARKDPALSAVSRRAAETCNARIEVLRASQ